ncbi:MAG TPA: phosphotransferase [Solirubrobacteraceae bacterium]
MALVRDLVDRILIAAEGLPADAEPVLVHGDLNLRHALVSKTGRLAGVIDWGDMCRAPRCVDLPLYWSLFDSQSRTAFLDSYGPVTRATLMRARVLALFFDATLALYADDKGMDELRREARKGLDRTVTD